jgi:penicillin-binding protein 1A
MDITAPIKPPEQRRRRRRGSPMLRFIGFLFAMGMFGFVIVAAVAAFVLWNASQDLPDYEVLAKYEPAVMTRLHANDGRLIAEYARERRIYVPIKSIPENLIEAFLSAEDKNFYQHGGLDIQGILRALVTNLSNFQSGRRFVGASTITQQVAKNFLLSSEVSMDRKLKEAILAIRMERAFTKEQILELYLNEIYLGMGAYGVAAAAQTYWDKALNELSLADVAYLAALPKAPNNYHPFRQTERAIARRNWVIDRMVENGFATYQEGEEAKAQPLNVTVRPTGPRIFAAEYFAEEVRRDIMELFGEEKLYGGGLSVRTTLDPKLQRIAKKVLTDGLSDYDRRHGWRGPIDTIEPEGDWGAALSEKEVWSDIEPWRLAVVLEVAKDKAVIGLRPPRLRTGGFSTERETGEIPFSEARWARPKLQRGLGGEPKAMTDVVKPGDVIYVTPRESKDAKDNVKGQWSLRQIPEIQGALVAMDPHTGRVLALVGGFSFYESEFDRAVQARRQPGSSYKPIIYAAALDNGYTPASIVVDGPFCLEAAAGRPQWCPKNYEGKFSGPSTLRHGIERSRNLMTVQLAHDLGMPLVAEYSRRFGVYDDLMPVLPMALGAGETTLLRMVGAYAMMANGGKQVRGTLIDRIQDRYGRTIWRHDTRECVSCAARSWNGEAEPGLPDDREQVIDPQTAYQITAIMEGVIQRGTGQRIKSVGKPLAGKTGTTNEGKDAWFVGYSPDLVVGVFIGFDNPTPMGRGETGGGVAAPVFRDFMQMALADKPAVPFRMPPGIKLARVNLKTGLRAAPGDQTAIMEAFKPGTEPYGSETVDPSFATQDEGMEMSRQQDGYPQHEAAYPPQNAGYPPQDPNFPQQDGGYPQHDAGYPPPPGYPPQDPNYPQHDAGHPPPPPGYPGPGAGYPPQDPDYPPQDYAYPPPPVGLPPPAGVPPDDRALTSGPGGLY